jgi:hypothetical protein
MEQLKAIRFIQCLNHHWAGSFQEGTQPQFFLLCQLTLALPHLLKYLVGLHLKLFYFIILYLNCPTLLPRRRLWGKLLELVCVHAHIGEVPVLRNSKTLITTNSISILVVIVRKIVVDELYIWLHNINLIYQSLSFIIHHFLNFLIARRNLPYH